MDQALLDRILRSPRLPTLPTVAVRILDLTQDADVCIKELAETIEHDQALAARVLRTVNSSFYGLRRPCTNINQALVMLGLSTVKTLALSFSLVSSLRQHGGEEFDHVSYWRRDLHTAVAARIIATEAKLPIGDEAFLGGLLQDSGMLAMYQALGQEYLAVVRSARNHHELASQELAEFELTHADVGAMLGQRWKLPAELFIGIKYHEQPAAAPEEHAGLVRAIGLGNIASDVLTSERPGTALRRFQIAAAKWFGLPPAACDELLRKITDAAGEVSALFLLNIGEAIDPGEIIARAESQLAELAEHVDLGDEVHGPICRLASDSEEFDPLTGILTKRAMLMRLLDADEDAGQGWTLVAFEIDHFARMLKSVEQTETDGLLVETASVLEQQFARLGGLLARWEGARFVVLLNGVEESAALSMIERARTALKDQMAGWFPQEHAGRLSWSAGVASLGVDFASPNRGLEGLTRALNALDCARRAGGGKTYCEPARMAA